MTATNGASLTAYLNEIDEPRKPGDGPPHDLREIFVIAKAATLSDSDSVENIASWARKTSENRAAWPWTTAFCASSVRSIPQNLRPCFGVGRVAWSVPWEARLRWMARRWRLGHGRRNGHSPGQRLRDGTGRGAELGEDSSQGQ